MYGLISRIRALNGALTWDEAVVDIPAPLLLALADAGSVLDGAGVASHMADPSIVDCCRTRVIDGDADDAVALAVSRQRAVVAVSGDAAMCDAATAMLVSAGVSVISHHNATTRPSVALSLTHSNSDLMRLDSVITDVWLRVGIPHLGACVAGTRALIGPLTVPGISPCARCVELHLRASRRLTESSVHDLTYQHHRSARSPDALAICIGLAVGRALLFVDALAPEGIAEALMIDSSGRVATIARQAHSACGCAALPSSP